MFKILGPVALPLALAACQTPQPTTLADTAVLPGAANPFESIRNANPAPVVTEYRHRQPVDPRPWRDLNREQGPIAGAGS